MYRILSCRCWELYWLNDPDTFAVFVSFVNNLNMYCLQMDAVYSAQFGDTFNRTVVTGFRYALIEGLHFVS